jgi:hypothetical protein
VHEVFINYRTKDGKETAYVIDQALSGRFGTDSIFRAPKSIEPGANYIDALVNGVRRSSVLLALIGPDWLNAPDRKRPGRRALDGAEDWVRREIEEAFACGVLVVPILLGRHTEQLEPQHLPLPLAGLADCQYLQFSLRNAESDLARLGDRLAKQVPALAALDKSRQPQKHQIPPTAWACATAASAAASATSGGTSALSSTSPRRRSTPVAATRSAPRSTATAPTTSPATTTAASTSSSALPGVARAESDD